MDDRDRVAQYKTIKRLQKKYLVRCNESLSNIIEGNGVKPVSAMRRLEREIGRLQKEMGKLTEKQILAQDSTSGKEHQQTASTAAARQQAADLQQRKEELGLSIKEKQKALRMLELH